MKKIFWIICILSAINLCFAGIFSESTEYKAAFEELKLDLSKNKKNYLIGCQTSFRLDQVNISFNKFFNDYFGVIWSFDTNLSDPQLKVIDGKGYGANFDKYRSYNYNLGIFAQTDFIWHGPAKVWAAAGFSMERTNAIIHAYPLFRFPGDKTYRDTYTNTTIAPLLMFGEDIYLNGKLKNFVMRFNFQYVFNKAALYSRTNNSNFKLEKLLNLKTSCGLLYLF